MADKLKDQDALTEEEAAKRRGAAVQRSLTFDANKNNFLGT